MKTKIGRRAKSALAILLTLCMVFSVFTVGIASVGAATADSESVGKNNGIYYKHLYFGVPTSWTESFTHLYAAAKQSNGYCVILGELTESVSGSRLYVSSTNPDITGHSDWGTENLYFFATNASYTKGTGYDSVTTVYDTAASSTEVVNELSSAENNYFFYSTTGATTGGAIAKTWNNYGNMGYLGTDGTIAPNQGTTPYAQQKTVCSTGGSTTISGYRIQANSYDTIEAYSSTSGQLGCLVGSKVTVTATPSNGAYEFDGFYSDSSYTTPITTGVNENTYTYNVTSTNENTVYVKFRVNEPQYCLVGNVDDGLIINNEVVTPATTGLSGAEWWTTWQNNLVIDNKVSDGVYSITFTVNPDSRHTGGVDLGIYLKDVGQKAFIYNDTPYNTSSSDLEVPDAGISDGLYAYDVSTTDAGGALVLKKGQTYTLTIDQTQRHDSNSPYGKITITATDAFVETVAKKRAYNATGRTYDAVSDAAETVGTVSAVPNHDTKNTGFTSTLTATVTNNDYTFKGWYSDAACTSQVVAASACERNGDSYTHSVTVNDTTYYYALFEQTQPTDYAVAITQPAGGTISFTGGVDDTNSVSTTAYQDAVVSLSLNVVDHSKEFANWKIVSNNTGLDVTSSVLNSAATATAASFNMPGYPVTVTANLQDKTPVSVTVTSSNTTLGTATYTNGTYYVGDTINISATNAGGVFSRWVVTGGTVADANAASTTITATGSTITARAVFDYKTYQLFSDKDTAGNNSSAMYTLVRQDDGTYVSTRTVDASTGSFTIYDVTAKKYAVPDNSDFEFNTGYLSHDNASWNDSATTFKYKIKSGLSGKYYVVFNPNTGSYGNVSVTTTNPMGTIATIYAKDGSIRYKTDNSTSGALWDDGGEETSVKGVTVVSKINGSAVANPDTSRYPSTGLSNHLKIYSAAMGSTITIQTTVNSTYQTQGYYVGMFVINGWKVAATDTGKGVYTATYTLTDEYNVNNLDGNASFEITPVYYNKNFEYITFYVDAESVPSKWGKTISTCADYNGAGSAHFEGSYPGQPLGREGDLYEIKVAKYYYSLSGITWTKQSNYYPSVTITAYNYDNVHHYYYTEADETLNEGNNNYQTYDFSDSAYLAQIDKIEAILFRCKYETEKSGWQIYGKDDNAANYNATTPQWNYVDDKYTQFNTWQVLTDYYGNPIDALGNRIVKSGSGDSAVYYTSDDLSSISFTQNDTNQIHIVSYGNRYTKDDAANARTSARWATGWAVYQGGSTGGTNYQIAYGTPADFICTTPGLSSTSKVHYLNNKNASALTNKLTFISYDKERTNKIANYGDTGERIDGQWYYSAEHDFKSNVKVAFTTATANDNSSISATNATTIESDTNAANNTGYIGAISGTKATLDGNTTHTYSNVTTEAALNCTLGSGYTFVGWYIYDGTNYTKVHDNFADLNTTILMKKNYTIVAVVRQVAEGSLVITHTRYTGTNPDAHDGTGKYYVSATIVHHDANGVVTGSETISEAQNSIAITALAATDTIQIKLRTVCNGADTFYAWYEEALDENYNGTGYYYEICDEENDPLGESQVSYEFFEADCSTFFNGNEMLRKTLDFYSDIVHVSAYATLTYKYYDRFAANGKNQMVSYVVRNVPLTEQEIEAGYIPNDDKISKYAPSVVDTIYTDTKWTIVGTKVERAASNVTLMATQTDKTCYVLYMENPGTYLLQSTTTETSVEDAIGPGWSSRIVPFNSWLIDENADLDNPVEDDFYVKAPMTYVYQDTTWNFIRFDVYEYDRTTGLPGNVIFSSNDNVFGYRIYADCVIYPVYETSASGKTLTAKIEPAVLNREVYGEAASLVDRLYADLLISFVNVAAATGGETPEVIRELDQNSPYTIETGVILDKSVDLSDADYNTLKQAAIAGTNDNTESVIEKYKSSFVNKSAVEALVKDGTATTGLTKYATADNRVLTNKNRVDKVFRYTNSPAAQKRVYAAYSYILIKKNGVFVAFAVSDPQYYNFCYLGNKPLATVSE